MQSIKRNTYFINKSAFKISVVQKKSTFYRVIRIECISRCYTMEINSIDNIVHHAFCYKRERACIMHELYFQQLAKRKVTIDLKNMCDSNRKKKIDLAPRNTSRLKMSNFDLHHTSTASDEMYFNNTQTSI